MKITLLAATACLLPVTASADDFGYGAKTGFYTVSQSGFDPAWMISGHVSHDLPKMMEKFDFSLELEASTTITEGDVDLDAPAGSSGEYDATVFSLSAVGRTTGDLYGIGRLGFSDTEIEVGASGSGLQSVSGKTEKTGVVFGGGVGMDLGGFPTEFELNIYTVGDENAYYLTGGVAY
ncbi:hypothetical protein GP5015_976 [gamma proteobacterium HTCC5015]|nr:hypothetical protein GP5015_976 [gamma proteobacterium HTCC5015]